MFDNPSFKSSFKSTNIEKTVASLNDQIDTYDQNNCLSEGVEVKVCFCMELLI